MKKLLLVFGPLVGAAIVACAGKKEPAPPTAELSVPPLIDAAPPATPADADPPTYSENAETAYAAAETLLHDQNWDDATTAYQDLKKKFSYSRYAVLADLRIADIAFARGNYDDAEHLYRVWLRYHPSNALKAQIVERADTAECRKLSRPACVDTYDAGI